MEDFYSSSSLHAYIIHELDALHLVADDETAVALVANQDVGAEAEQKEWNLQLASR